MWCRTPPLSTSLMNCHRAPSSGCAVSYAARKSLYNLLEDHPGCSAPSLGPGGLGLQRLGLCYRTDLFCHSCPQVDGARTHSHPHRTAERWCYGTTELKEQQTHGWTHGSQLGMYELQSTTDTSKLWPTNQTFRWNQKNFSYQGWIEHLQVPAHIHNAVLWQSQGTLSNLVNRCPAPRTYHLWVTVQLSIKSYGFMDRSNN